MAGGNPGTISGLDFAGLLTEKSLKLFAPVISGCLSFCVMALYKSHVNRLDCTSFRYFELFIRTYIPIIDLKRRKNSSQFQLYSLCICYSNYILYAFVIEIQRTRILFLLEETMSYEHWIDPVDSDFFYLCQPHMAILISAFFLLTLLKQFKDFFVTVVVILLVWASDIIHDCQEIKGGPCKIFEVNTLYIRYNMLILVQPG